MHLCYNLVYEHKQATLMAVIDVTERRAQENYTTHLANHDLLTGLPNRQSFRTLLDNTLRRPSQAKPGSAVVLVDIDNFKDINDTLGHPVGDLLITAVAERLARNMREIDSVSRLGGDEFAIVLDQITRPEDVEQVLNRLMDDFLEPFDIDGNHISVDFSAGITLVPRDGDESDAILRNADLALYRPRRMAAGSTGFLNRVCSFTSRAAAPSRTTCGGPSRRRRLNYTISRWWTSRAARPLGSKPF